MASTNYVLAEYVWIGGRGELRSKTKVIHGAKSVVLEDLPEWNYDGSSTEQAPGDDSEVILVPRAMYADPFRRYGSNVLVVCDTYAPTKSGLTPIPTNSRNLANEIFESKLDEKPWFGIEQEYTLFQDGRPLGWPKSNARTFGNPMVQMGFPAPQGPYYCSAGAATTFGRNVVEDHLEHCLYAGLTISGINAEVMPGQWEFQVGPCEGIESGDMMVAARYILLRVSETHKISVSVDPKPIPGDWNGTGCHTNFSTAAMRDVDNSLQTVIYPAIDKLGKRHHQHIHSYGAGNDLRLTGRHETAGIDKFSYGVANRGASVRIPNSTAMSGKGYFEDRRPASNMDPYIVTSMIFDSAILDGKYSERFASIKSEGVDIGGPVKPEKKAPGAPKHEGGVLENTEKAAEAPASKPKKVSEKKAVVPAKPDPVAALDKAEKTADIPASKSIKTPEKLTTSTKKPVAAQRSSRETVPRKATAPGSPKPTSKMSGKPRQSSKASAKKPAPTKKPTSKKNPTPSSPPKQKRNNDHCVVV